MGSRELLNSQADLGARVSLPIPAVPKLRQLSWTDLSQFRFRFQMQTMRACQPSPGWLGEGCGREASLRWRRSDCRLQLPEPAWQSSELRLGAAGNQTRRPYYRVSQASVS